MTCGIGQKEPGAHRELFPRGANDANCDDGVFCNGSETCVGGTPWINEIHYDNSGGDRNEGLEVAGSAGTNLSGWQLIGYNGNGGGTYATVNLSGTLASKQAGYGTYWFAISGLQNGSPDGVALIDPQGAVVQFLSYEGTFTATNGPAGGMFSEDIGVAETSSTTRNWSLQLEGVGNQASDFTWAPPAPHTRGSVNGNQMFTP